MNRKNEKFKKLISVLPNKREDSSSMKELSDKLGMTTREVRQYILEARNKGLLILSDEEGYWESDDEDEIREFISKRIKVAKTIITYTREMDRAKKKRESHSGKN